MKSDESAVSREEKRDETAVSRSPFLVLTVKFIRRERSSPNRFAKISFGGGFFGFRKQTGRPCPFLRCIREPRSGHRPDGFQGLSMQDFGRCRPDRDWMDSADG